MNIDEQARALELLAAITDKLRAVRQVLEDALPSYPADAGLVRQLNDALVDVLRVQGIVQDAGDDGNGHEAGRG